MLRGELPRGVAPRKFPDDLRRIVVEVFYGEGQQRIVLTQRALNKREAFKAVNGISAGSVTRILRDSHVSPTEVRQYIPQGTARQAARQGLTLEGMIDRIKREIGYDDP